MSASQQSNAELLAELLSQHGAALELYAAQWTASAGDCVQEAFIQLAKELQQAINDSLVQLVAARFARQFLKPAELEGLEKSLAPQVDFSNPWERLRRKDRDWFTLGICDGSVRILDRTLPNDTLRALITIDGGEVVEWP